jgi:hypothetical protein
MSPRLSEGCCSEGELEDVDIIGADGLGRRGGEAEGVLVGRHTAADGAVHHRGEGASGKGIGVVLEANLHLELVASLPDEGLEATALLGVEAGVVLGEHLLNDTAENIHGDTIGGAVACRLGGDPIAAEHSSISRDTARSGDHVLASESGERGSPVSGGLGADHRVVRDSSDGAGVAEHLVREIADDEVLEGEEVHRQGISDRRGKNGGSIELSITTLGAIIQQAASVVSTRLDGVHNGSSLSLIRIGIVVVFRRILDEVDVSLARRGIVESGEVEGITGHDVGARELDLLTKDRGIMAADIETEGEGDSNRHLVIPVPYILSAHTPFFNLILSVEESHIL